VIIDIYKDDVVKYFYFICAKAQDTMYGGLSGKKDFIGGIFDRWINIISEGAIFNKYFLKDICEDIEAISDFYIYDPSSVGIAPDLIGVRCNGKTIPFAIFGNDGWIPFHEAPQIEVKTFKKKQYLVSLRNQHYEGKFLILLEMSLNPDYLLPFIQDQVISNEIYNSMQMDDGVFIKTKSRNSIHQTPQISKPDKLGYLELIGVSTANIFMRSCDLCEATVSPHYITEIRQTRDVRNPAFKLPLSDFVFKHNGLYRFNDSWYNLFPLKDIKTLAWDIKNLVALSVIKVSKSSVTLNVLGSNAYINGVMLKHGNCYIVKTGLINRFGSSGEEYFMHKSLIHLIQDYEEEMTNQIKKHIKDYQ
jgi:hypothetical protein